MTPTTEGRFRVLPTPPGPDGGSLLLVDRSDMTATTVQGQPASAVAETVAGLRPGYLVDATLAWTDGEAAVTDCTVIEPTLLTFGDGVTNLFEVALDTWEETRQAGEAVGSTVTYSNDGAPNGALYTFAQQPGERDLYAEFRSGRRPLEPLLDRVEAEPPHEVFVFRPATHEFVLVYVVLAKGSMLADTVRDTYDCPRPSEPLADPDR